MTVKATRHYKIVRPGEIYPTAFNTGDVLPEWAAEQALADGAAERAGGKPPKQAEPATDAPVEQTAKGGGARVGKTTKRIEIEIDGKPTKFRAGVTVYDEVLDKLLAAGAAIETRAGEVPETK